MSADIIPSPSYIHPSRVPLTQIKEPTISKIELTEKDQIKLKTILNSQKMGMMSKDLHIRKLVGSCFTCGQVPQFILTKYYQDVKLIEKYCTKCMDAYKIDHHKKL